MKFIPNVLYHIYNRGNQKRKIFFERENYIFFLEKVKKELLPACDILCYCLMPNHFHFLVYTKPGFPKHHLNNKIGILLRSYTRAMNKRYDMTGSLFQQKTKAKMVCDPDFEEAIEDILLQGRENEEDISSCLFSNYGRTCFNYIHRNPLEASLVSKAEEWEFSSCNEYLGKPENTFCNLTKAENILGFSFPLESNSNRIPA